MVYFCVQLGITVNTVSQTEIHGNIQSSKPFHLIFIQREGNFAYLVQNVFRP